MQPHIVQALFNNASVRKLSKKQIVIYEGDPIERLYYIASGYVKVYNTLGSGTERTIFIYGPGEMFPFTSYLSGAGMALYFYECMTDVQAYVMPPKQLEEKVKDNYEIGEALVGYTGAVGQQFVQRIDTLSVNDARRKVIALLAFLVHKAGTKEELSRLNIPLTTQDIASMCGLTRETATTQLIRLRQAGILSGSRNLVVNVPKLEKIGAQLSILSSHNNKNILQ